MTFFKVLPFHLGTEFFSLFFKLGGLKKPHQISFKFNSLTRPASRSIEASKNILNFLNGQLRIPDGRQPYLQSIAQGTGKIALILFLANIVNSSNNSWSKATVFSHHFILSFHIIYDIFIHLST